MIHSSRRRRAYVVLPVAERVQTSGLSRIQCSLRTKVGHGHATFNISTFGLNKVKLGPTFLSARVVTWAQPRSNFFQGCALISTIQLCILYISAYDRPIVLIVLVSRNYKGHLSRSDDMFLARCISMDRAWMDPRTNTQMT